MSRVVERNLLVIECEGSGLSDQGYPVSIGVSGPNGQSWYWLVCPMEDWDYWDSFAEAIHGIAYNELLEAGRDCFIIAREMNAIFKGNTLYATTPWTPRWITRMFSESGVQMAFEVVNIVSELEEPQRDHFGSWDSQRPNLKHAMRSAQTIRGQLISMGFGG